MDDEKFKGYLNDFVSLLKKQAMEAKADADKPDKEHDGYNQGHLMAYYSVISLLKHQAFVLNIDENDIGLANIDPDADLLSLHKRTDIDPGQDIS